MRVHAFLSETHRSLTNVSQTLKKLYCLLQVSFMLNRRQLKAYVFSVITTIKSNRMSYEPFLSCSIPTHFNQKKGKQQFSTIASSILVASFKRVMAEFIAKLSCCLKATREQVIYTTTKRQGIRRNAHTLFQQSLKDHLNMRPERERE